MSKCIGCGITLQYDNENIEGYAKENSKYCERCFRIKNYGDYKTVLKDNTTFIDILKSIDKNDLVVLVMDLFNLPKNLDLIKENITNNILVVLSKRDILPKVIYEEKILNYIKNYNINYIDSVIVSSNKNYNFDLLIDKINKHNKTGKVYFVGYTNSGKSTLINKLMYNYSNTLPTITTSMLPNTTLSSIEIKYNDNITFIDTPGLLNNTSIEYYVDIKTLKKINPKNIIKPKTYQIKTKQYLNIDNLLTIELQNNNVTLFISNSLKVTRLYKNQNLNKSIKVKSGEDLVIPGLGFIKFTKDEEIKYSVVDNVEVYTRKSLI